MSWEDYKKYKESGKTYKVFWVRDFWDSIDFTEEQYRLMKRAYTILWLVMTPLLIFLGAILYSIILDVMRLLA